MIINPSIAVVAVDPAPTDKDGLILVSFGCNTVRVLASASVASLFFSSDDEDTEDIEDTKARTCAVTEAYCKVLKRMSIGREKLISVDFETETDTERHIIKVRLDEGEFGLDLTLLMLDEYILEDPDHPLVKMAEEEDKEEVIVNILEERFDDGWSNVSMCA